MQTTQPPPAADVSARRSYAGGSAAGWQSRTGSPSLAGSQYHRESGLRPRAHSPAAIPPAPVDGRSALILAQWRLSFKCPVVWYIEHDKPVWPDIVGRWKRRQCPPLHQIMGDIVCARGCHVLCRGQDRATPQPSDPEDSRVPATAIAAGISIMWRPGSDRDRF
jgi:hypothetical protein